MHVSEVEPSVSVNVVYMSLYLTFQLNLSKLLSRGQASTRGHDSWVRCREHPYCRRHHHHRSARCWGLILNYLTPQQGILPWIDYFLVHIKNIFFISTTILCWISFTLTHLELFLFFCHSPISSIRIYSWGIHQDGVSFIFVFIIPQVFTSYHQLQHMFIVLWTEHWGHCTDSDGSSVRPHAAAAADAPWGKQWEETPVRQLPLPTQPPAEVSYAVIMYQ